MKKIAFAAGFFFALLVLPVSAAQEKPKLNHLSAGIGTPVVLIHGSYGSLQDYTYSIFKDVAARYHAIAVDLPGHGRSRRTRLVMTLTDHAEALHELLVDLKVQNPVLVGHSWGGAVVLAYALKYPDEVSGIVLLAAYTTPFEKLQFKYRLTTAPIVGGVFASALVRPFARFGDPLKLVEDSFKPNIAPPDYAKAAVAQAAEPAAFQATSEDIKSLGTDLKEIQARLGEIKIPVIIVAGDSDAVAPLERHAIPLHNKLANSELIVLPGVGHQPHFAKPDMALYAISLAVKKSEMEKE